MKLQKKEESFNSYSSSGGAESSFKFIASMDGARTSSNGLFGVSLSSSSLESLIRESENSSYIIQTGKLFFLDIQFKVVILPFKQINHAKPNKKKHLSITNRNPKCLLGVLSPILQCRGKTSHGKSKLTLCSATM